jgi:hypothetical protein
MTKKIVTKLTRQKRINLAENEVFEYLCSYDFRLHEICSFGIEEDISNEVIFIIAFKSFADWKIKYIYNENGLDIFHAERKK